MWYMLEDFRVRLEPSRGDAAGGGADLFAKSFDRQ
jgi:hypothetical protein